MPEDLIVGDELSVPEVRLAPLSFPVRADRLERWAFVDAFRLDGTRCLVGWTEGTQSFRAGVLDLTTGDLAGRTPIKGGIAGYLADEERLWVLTTFGLQELDRETLKVRRSLRAGVPKYPIRFLRLGPNHGLIVVKYGQSHVIVDLEDMTISGRLRFPEPDAALATDDGVDLISVRYGKRRRLGPDHAFAGKATAVPTGLGAIADEETISFVTGVPKPPAAIVAETGLDSQRYVSIAPSGSVATLSAAGLTQSPHEHAGVARLFGRTPAGELVAGDSDSAANPIMTVTILSADASAVVGTVLLAEHAYRIAVMDDRRAVIAPRSFGPTPELTVLTW